VNSLELVLSVFGELELIHEIASVLEEKSFNSCVCDRYFEAAANIALSPTKLNLNLKNNEDGRWLILFQFDVVVSWKSSGGEKNLN
jgi:hypothetical protein